MNPILGLILTVFLLGVNAFFVAGEFATTSTRRAQIEPLVAQGKRGATKALFALEHVSLMLAISQLGVTLASTSLGMVAEPAIAHLVEGPMEKWGLPATSVHVVGFAIALLLVLFLHVVFGEMVPKNISIAMPHTALLILAPPLVALGHVVRPLIEAMDKSANWFVKLAGLTPKSEISASFTAEEVASIVERSQEAGTIHDELGLLTGTLEFSERDAGEAMVPLSDLVVLPEDVTPAQVEQEVAQTGFSRYPLVGENGEIVGYIHVKDVLYADQVQRHQPVERWRIRAMEMIPETAEVEESLRHMQRSGTHCAEITNSDQDVVGVLFLEDILEELVGEVRDSLHRNPNL